MVQLRRSVLVGLVIGLVSWSVPGSSQNGARNGEWRAYRADEASTAYSPLDQISPDSVKNLQVA